MLLESLTLHRRFLPEDHPAINRNLGNLENIYFDQEKYQAAELFYKEAFEIRREEYGDSSEAATLCLRELNRTAALNPDPEFSVRLHTEVLALAIEIFGYEHYLVSDSFTNLGITPYEQAVAVKNTVEAVKLFEDAVKNFDQALALMESNWVYANNAAEGRIKFGQTLFELGDKVRAREIWAEAIPLIGIVEDQGQTKYSKMLVEMLLETGFENPNLRRLAEATGIAQDEN